MISRLVYVTCDVCGAPAGGTEDLQDTGAAARKRALRLGFVRIDGRDLCPAHKPSATPPSTTERGHRA